MTDAVDLTRQRILVIEDEWITAREIADAFRMRGATIIGPVPSVPDALRAIQEEKLDGAILDVHLQGETAYAVADALASRGVPFLLATGYGENLIPAAYRALPRCQKPFEVSDIFDHWALLKSKRKPIDRCVLQSNRVLAGLSPDAFEKIAPHLEVVALPKRTLLDPRSSYFFLTGVASWRILNSMRETAEVGVLGSEGVATTYQENGRRLPRVRFTMITDGTAARLNADTLLRLTMLNRELYVSLQGQAARFLDQVAANLLASARYTVRARVARWLLLMDERCGTSRLSVTHDDIAFALGTRRAGVTVAVKELTEAGCIQHSRRYIEIIERDTLIECAAGCYP